MFAITLDQMKQVFPLLPAVKAQAYLVPLNTSLDRYSINTPMRVAAFCAQIGHESIDLTILRELPHTHVISWCSYCQKIQRGHVAGEQYEGRLDLGNDRPGDGIRYIGRGGVQITGKKNYERMKEALGIDFVASPELMEEPRNAILVSCIFWNDKGLNAHADDGNFDRITKLINGGFNGKADRDMRYARARRVFNVIDTMGMA